MTDDAKIASSLTEMVSKMEDLEQLLDVLMDGVMILDGDGRFLHLNKGGEKAFGTSRQEIKGHNFWEAPWNLRLEDAPLEEDGKLLFREVLQKKKTLSALKLKLDRPDGTSGYYLVNATPWGESGRRLGLVGVFADITEMRHAEKERERVEKERKIIHAKLEATIQSLAHGVIIYDADGTIVSANLEAEEITGFPHETFGLPFADRWDRLQVETSEGKPLSPEKVPEACALRGERVTGEILRFRHSPEKVVWVAVSAAPIICDGETVGAVVSFSDLTDLHRLLERDKTFMHMVSHDMRLPLTVINGHANLLLAGFGQANEKELATSTSAIFAAVRKAERILDDLADLTLLEQGQIQLDRQLLSPAAVIEQLLAENEPALDRQRLRVEVPEGLPPIYADYRRLERILINLVTNALKFSPRDSQVRIRASQENGEVVFAVKDDGPGIESDELSRIFDPYYRARGAEATSGTGLGLYIARMLAAAHGGRIWADSLPGQGSTFYVTVSPDSGGHPTEATVQGEGIK